MRWHFLRVVDERTNLAVMSSYESQLVCSIR